MYTFAVAEQSVRVTHPDQQDDKGPQPITVDFRVDPARAHEVELVLEGAGFGRVAMMFNRQGYHIGTEYMSSDQLREEQDAMREQSEKDAQRVEERNRRDAEAAEKAAAEAPPVIRQRPEKAGMTIRGSTLARGPIPDQPPRPVAPPIPGALTPEAGVVNTVGSLAGQARVAGLSDNPRALPPNAFEGHPPPPTAEGVDAPVPTGGLNPPPAHDPDLARRTAAQAGLDPAVVADANEQARRSLAAEQAALAPRPALTPEQRATLPAEQQAQADADAARRAATAAQQNRDRPDLNPEARARERDAANTPINNPDANKGDPRQPWPGHDSGTFEPPPQPPAPVERDAAGNPINPNRVPERV